MSISSLDIEPAAPGTILIALSPVFSFIIIPATPVDWFGSWIIESVLIPASSYNLRAILAFWSSPILVIKFTFPPSLAAAIAWFDPFPPGPTIWFLPKTVSPLIGILSAKKQRSATNTPKTHIELIIYQEPKHYHLV